MTGSAQSTPVLSKRRLRIASRLLLVLYAAGFLWMLWALTYAPQHARVSINGIDPTVSFAHWVYDHWYIGLYAVIFGLIAALACGIYSDIRYGHIHTGVVTGFKVHVKGEDPAGDPRSGWIDVEPEIAYKLRLNDTFPWAK